MQPKIKHKKIYINIVVSYYSFEKYFITSADEVNVIGYRMVISFLNVIFICRIYFGFPFTFTVKFSVKM